MIMARATYVLGERKHTLLKYINVRDVKMRSVSMEICLTSGEAGDYLVLKDKHILLCYIYIRSNVQADLTKTTIRFGT